MNEKSNGIDYHEKLAAKWDDRYRSGSFQRRAKLFKDQLLPLIPQGGKWLDAGCGSGYFSRVLAVKADEIVGLDASEKMIYEARLRVKEESLDSYVSFEKVETIETLPFENEVIDGCICLSVIEYLDRPYDCLDSITRVLKTGGFLVLSVPHCQSTVRKIQYIIRNIRNSETGSSLDYLETSTYSKTPAVYHQELSRRGFKIIKTAGFDAVIPTFLHRLFPPSLVYIVAQKRTIRDFDRRTKETWK